MRHVSSRAGWGCGRLSGVCWKYGDPQSQRPQCWYSVVGDGAGKRTKCIDNEDSCTCVWSSEQENYVMRGRDVLYVCELRKP